MTTQDDEIEPPSDEERREAELLARALAGQGTAGLSPELETAALLRLAGSAARGPAPLPDGIGRAPRPAEAPARRAGRRWRWGWLAPALLVPAGAALLLVYPRSRTEAPPPALASVPPPAELLSAQARAARGEGRALAALDEQMRRYRGALYRTLQEE